MSGIIHALTLARILDHVDRLPPIVIVRRRNMTAIDATGLRAFEDLADGLHKSGRARRSYGQEGRDSPSRPRRITHQITSTNATATTRKVMPNSQSVR